MALVPARAGSKGIPGKNLRAFREKPLVAWAVEVGQETCDEVYVSSDSNQILDVAARSGKRPAGYEFGPVCAPKTCWRPARLAQDDTPMIDVVRHFVERIDAAYQRPPIDVVVLLQPTQPLRKPEHIRAALKLLEETGADSVVSVVQIPAHYSPDYALEINGGELRPAVGNGEYDWWPRIDEMAATRRQECKPAYSRDGTVYAIKRETIEKGSLYGDHCVPLVIPANESCNLDTEEDWQRAEAMVRGK